MSTITKQAVQAVADLKAGYTLGHADVAILNELARIALALLEAEPVGEVVLGEYDDCGCHPDARVVCIAADGQADWENFKDGTRLFAAPPATVSVPDALDDYVNSDDHPLLWSHNKGWNACRAAMLQGAAGNSPVIPDDVRRMDWLVSKTVDVREPMVYGSHSLFWSQTITDEEDDYHATKLREQIDAAMEAEQAAAPQQEVK
ncbi:hypothetical protein [Enterobacter asburiae]|uniref:hypothetical protein n=1 Tax=Enterobacter asburiae TaxID=61645 RepID=UPI0032F0359B